MYKKFLSNDAYATYKITAKRYRIKAIFKRHFRNWLDTLPLDEFNRAARNPTQATALEFLKKYDETHTQ